MNNVNALLGQNPDDNQQHLGIILGNQSISLTAIDALSADLINHGVASRNQVLAIVQHLTGVQFSSRSRFYQRFLPQLINSLR